MSSNQFERIWLLLTCIITNSCDDDRNHVCNTTNFDNSSTVANGLQQATEMCVTGFQTNGIVFVIIIIN